jgi:hypothetical protein
MRHLVLVCLPIISSSTTVERSRRDSGAFHFEGHAKLRMLFVWLHSREGLKAQSQ